MQQHSGYSRLNPAYLARRHAGAFLLIFAVGLAAGLLAHAVLTPREYESAFQRSFDIVPPAASVGFDWQGREKQWAGVLAGREGRALFTANLRAAVKNLVAAEIEWNPEKLRSDLLALRTAKKYSAAPGSGRLRRELAPAVEIARHDLAGNIDFQSLARIVVDLDPRQDITGWDFSPHAEKLEALAPGGRLIVRPGPEDPFFAVFYHLHALLNGGKAASSPAEAWLTAATEVGSRLARESDFQGGGGFGRNAGRELARELEAIPLLVANSLYFAAESVFEESAGARREAGDWRDRLQNEAVLRVEHGGAARGSLDAAVRNRLYIFAFPFDSPRTRIAPLVLRTLFDYIEALENVPPRRPTPERAAPVPEPEPEPQPEESAVPEPEPDAEAAEKAKARAAEEEAARQRLIAELEAELRVLRAARDAAALRLDLLLQSAGDLSAEALAARERADRLGERLEAVEILAGDRAVPEPDPQFVVLSAEREALLLHLAQLLQYCTDEHPFVVRARRDLAALETRLALFPQPDADAGSEEREIRLANLGKEWNAAEGNARVLAERRRRAQDDRDKALAELTAAELKLAERELAVEAERGKQSPESVLADALDRNVLLLAHSIDGLRAAPAEPSEPPAAPPSPPAEPSPAPEAEPAPGEARIVFSPLPELMPLMRLPVAGTYIYYGALLGLCLGLLWVIVREVLTFRLDEAYVAKRLVPLPVLAVLPAYEEKSYLAAARAEGGTAPGKGKRFAFIPSPVDIREPAALGKRKAVRMAKKKRKTLLWIAAALVILLAIGAHQAASSGFLTPDAPFAQERWSGPARFGQPVAAEQNP